MKKNSFIFLLILMAVLFSAFAFHYREKKGERNLNERAQVRDSDPAGIDRDATVLSVESELRFHLLYLAWH